VAAVVDMDRYLRDKDLKALTRKTYDNMGFEVRDILARSDLYEREGENQHAFCLSVSREYPFDVREHLLWRERADRLVFSRWALVMFSFEREIYANPQRDDLNDLWWDLAERLQLINRPPGREKPDWAAKIHLAVAPVYYHNYVLGNLISAQLRNHLEKHVTHGPFYENEVAGAT
jgi:Zn-dependent M32 family carboxypeptidase